MAQSSQADAVVRLRPASGEVFDAVVVGGDGRVMGLQRGVDADEALSADVVDHVMLLDGGKELLGDSVPEDPADVLQALLDHDAHCVVEPDPAEAPDL